MTFHRTTFEGVPIRYRKSGTGHPIVFLHGFCESIHIWDSFEAELGDSFLKLTIDLPGHGESGNKAGVHTTAWMAAAVNHVVNTEVTGRCIVAGHSMGGYVTLAFAQNFPEKLMGLCLFHSVPLADSDAKKSDRDRAIAAVRENKKGFLSALIPKLFAPAFVTSHPQVIEGAQAIAMGTPSEGIVAALEAMRDRPDLSHVLAHLSVPMLMILGKKDKVLPFDAAHETAKLAPESIVYALEDIGHMGFMELPVRTASMLKKFTHHCFGDLQPDGSDIA